MQPVKITIITVCYNAGATLARCMESVISQDYPHIEYLIIDGGSIDDSLTIASRYKDKVARLISEPDQGLYDAMNKGLALATGDVIGTLNADDFFIDDTLISAIAQAFNYDGADVVYGNLNFVNREGRIVRRWQSGEYSKGAFNWGWMPPHPTFYARRTLFARLGNYRLDCGTAADYDLMLRFMHNQALRFFYLNRTFLHMLTGGVSNKSWRNRVEALNKDFKSMRRNGIAFPYFTLLLKPLRKVLQYLK